MGGTNKKKIHEGQGGRRLETQGDQGSKTQRDMPQVGQGSKTEEKKQEEQTGEKNPREGGQRGKEKQGD